MRKNVRKYYGMTLKQWKTLGKIMNPPKAEHVTTVKEAIEQGLITIVSERVTKSGAKMLLLSNGKEFNAEHIETAHYFEI